MVAILHVLSAALLFVSHVAANPEPVEVINGLLVSRQIAPIDTSNIPAECKSDCEAVSNGLVGCTSIECICKDSTVTNMGNCLSCGVSIKGSGLDATTAQGVLDQITSACKAAGSPVKEVTVSSKGSKDSSSTKGNGAVRSTTLGVGAVAVIALGSILALA